MISEDEKSFLQVGFKQTVRALNESNVRKVFLASDCEHKIIDPVETLCSETQAPLFYIPTMKELGKMCGIEVGASCAVVLDKKF